MFYREQSPLDILKNGTLLYLRDWGALTRVLLPPLVMQVLGITLILALPYIALDRLVAAWPDMAVGVRWGILIVALVPGVGLFSRGFWSYLLWVSALNLMIRDILEHAPDRDPLVYDLRIRTRSVDFSLIWSFLFALIFVPFGLAFVPLPFAATNPDWALGGIALSIVILMFGWLVAAVVGLLLSLTFQVFAFQPGSAGASFFRSAALVRRHLWSTLLLGMLTLAIPYTLIPYLASLLADVTQLTALVAQALGILMKPVYEKTYQDVVAAPASYPPVVMSSYHWLHQNLDLALRQCVDLLLSLLVSMVILPWPTCWYAMLYAHARAQEAEQMDKALSEPAIDAEQPVA